MYVIIFSDGQITFEDISADCRNKSWAPLAVLKYVDGKITIPSFNDSDTAKSFAIRNLPKSWIKGSVFLQEVDFKSLESKGILKEVFDFPRLVKDRPDCTLSFEICEFAEQPDLLYVR